MTLVIVFGANLLFGWICAFALYFRPFGETLSFVLLMWAPIFIAMASIAAVLIRSRWLIDRPVRKGLMVVGVTLILGSLFGVMHLTYGQGAWVIANDLAERFRAKQ
jgi:hypothetical protein